jgi:ribosomal protein L4
MPDENFSQKINKKMYRAGMASILSQLAREGRLAVVDSLKLDSPKTKLLAAKFKAMNLESVMVIADRSRREPVPGLAQPGQRAGRRAALCRPRVAGALQESARHQGCDRQTQGDVRMSTLKFDEGRLMQVLVAPIVSEKATMVAEKSNQVTVQGAAATPPSPKSRPLWS